MDRRRVDEDGRRVDKRRGSRGRKGKNESELILRYRFSVTQRC